MVKNVTISTDMYLRLFVPFKLLKKYSLTLFCSSSFYSNQRDTMKIAYLNENNYALHFRKLNLIFKLPCSVTLP